MAKSQLQKQLYNHITVSTVSPTVSTLCEFPKQHEPTNSFKETKQSEPELQAFWLQKLQNNLMWQKLWRRMSNTSDAFSIFAIFTYESFNPLCLLATVKHDDGSVMVQAAISWEILGLMIALQGRITAQKCEAILQDQVLPMV